VRLDSEKKQLQREYREAMAELDSTRVTILKARLDRATAKLDLTEERIARALITAPMAGVVVEGDLSQSLGAPVEKGQQLFQIAPLDEYRVMLRVDEREIGHLAIGQTGRLALVGLPDSYLPFRVERITPIAAQADGRNFFSVEARLEDSPAPLRPGMDGVGKIDVGERRLAWIWMHPLVDWLRLQAWTWSG
jgi:multidrug efflux pump subunit AcrA (membrane-fusion protein)